MFVSATEIAHSRQHTLNNLLSFSQVCLDAGQSLTENLGKTARQLLAQGYQPESLASTWAMNAQQLGNCYRESLDILSHVHQAAIAHAEAQIRAADEMLHATIERASKQSPWEAGLALSAFKNSLNTAEQSLHEISVAAIETINQVEQESLQLIEKPTPATRRRSPRQRTS